MKVTILAAVAALGLAGAGAAEAAKGMQFWNLTTVTITDLRLAPTGTTKWGPNQCLNDSDKSVDADERLKLTSLTAGKYDVKLTDQKGRTCTVKNVEVKATGAYAFSIADKDLTDCAH